MKIQVIVKVKNFCSLLNDHTIIFIILVVETRMVNKFSEHIVQFLLNRMFFFYFYFYFMSMHIDPPLMTQT